MADHDQVGAKGLEIAGRIQQRFPLFQTRCGGRYIDHIGTEAHGRELKGNPRTGARLDKEIDQCLSPKGWNFLKISLPHPLEGGRRIENEPEFLGRMISQSAEILVVPVVGRGTHAKGSSG